MHPKGRSNQIQVKDLESQPHFSKCKVDNLANSTMQVSGMMPLLQSASLKIALQLQQVFLVSSGRERGWYVHDTYRVGDIVYWKVWRIKLAWISVCGAHPVCVKCFSRHYTMCSERTQPGCCCTSVHWKPLNGIAWVYERQFSQSRIWMR